MPDDTCDPSFENLIRYIQDSRGIDFRGYKRTSLRRRIALRMEQVGADGFRCYHALLEADPHEFGELLNTVLINVTSFFRDPDAWEVLRQEVVPKLLAPAAARPDPYLERRLRAGEEPYSLAMLFAEALGATEFCQAGEDLCDRPRRGGAGHRAPRRSTCRAIWKSPPDLREYISSGPRPTMWSAASFASA